MTKSSELPLLVKTLNGEINKRIPVWFMRQAGRHLPEYLELRAKNKTFLDFCYAPAAASEATLQPIRRYDIDAAIIFSDILVIPHALGQDVSFKEGIGPILAPIKTEEELLKLSMAKLDARLSPVYEALDRVKSNLTGQALIGFAGAPWTIATYMIQGKGGDRTDARIFAYQNPEFMDKLFTILIEAISQHLINQLNAGADCVQIFESWAEDLNDYGFENWVIKPTKQIIDKVRITIPDAKIIAFPRGASNRAALYQKAIGTNGVGLDIGSDIKAVREKLDIKTATQGNLDPMLLVSGGNILDFSIRKILEDVKDVPHIFNLGHGIVPQTKIENVLKAISIIRETR